MIAFSYYLLKVIICSAVLFSYYWVALRNKAFHGYNRFYLLTVIVLSLTVPLLQINIFHKAEIPATNAIKMLQIVTATDDFVDEIVMAPAPKHLTFSDALPYLYLLVSITLLIAFIALLFKIYVLHKKYKAVQIENIYLVNTDAAKGTPFSFFRTIFWNNKIDIHSTTGNRIFKHELAHIQERHSVDKMFLTLVLTIFWCNPIFWLIKKELNMIHEFIADKYAVEDGDTAEFAAMLLAVAYPQHRFGITNHFFYSPIKRRLAMITKNKNPKVNYLGRIIALPLTMLIFTAFTIKVKTVIDNKNNSEISNSTANNSPKETSLLNRITNIFTNNDKVKSSNENEVGVLEKTITVVIDAGHGGEDAGAQTEDGTTLEKDLCLALLKKIKALNKNDKIKLIFTREDDSYNTVKEKAAFAAAQNADLFISIHVDATDAKSAKSTTGLRVFVSNDDIENSTKSKLLATVIIDFFKTNYELPIKPYPVQRKNGIWVIKANNIPSILIEAGYITNPKDLAYLKSDEGQEAFAQNILNGIVSYRAVNYFKNNNLQTKLVDSPPSISANAVMVGRTKDSSKFRTLSSLKLEVSDKADWAKNGIVIINEKRYDFESLNNKIIKAKYCKIYTKGTPEMVIKYGENAKKGIWFFEDATIENSDKVGLNIVADSVYFTDASQKPKNKNNKIYNKEIDYSKALIIIDHVIKDEKAMKAMNPEDIKTINVLKDKSALALYGEKGRNGVLEITTKYPVINENIKTVINGEDPKLSVGNITKSRVSADEFVKQTEINVSDGYKFYSATVYFTGTNFPKVQVANLNGSDFTKAKDFLTLCKAGTSITFVNVKVLGPSGMMAIDDKSFTLY